MTKCFVHQEVQPNITMLTNLPCVDGLLPERSSIRERKEVTIDTCSKQETINLTGVELSTQESLAQSNSKILTDKFDLCEEDFLDMKLLETLEEELTLNERDYKPFWNGSVEEKSIQLPSIPRIDSQDLVVNSLSSYVTSSIPQSFMLNESSNPPQRLKNYPKTYLPLSLTSPQNTTEVESMGKVTRKIRIYPSDDLKKHLDYYFGAANYVYNKAIEYINKRTKEYYEAKEKGAKIKMEVGKSKVRSESVSKNSDIQKGSNEEWLLNVQYLSRIDAADEALRAFKAAMTNRRNGNIKGFTMRFRTKKRSKRTCYISNKALNIHSKIFFPSYHNTGKKDMSFKTKRKGTKDYNAYLVQNDVHDMKLSLDNGHYYLYVLMNGPSTPEEATDVNHIISSDPGVRTVHTCYTTHGKHIMIGDGFNDSLRKKYVYKIDKLQSKLSKNPNKKLQSTLNSLRTKVRNAVDNLHKQTAAFFLKNYNIILVGDFNDKGSATKLRKRGIHKGIVRSIQRLSHCKFRDHLQYRASLYPNKKVFVVNEAYTSKTCGNCGWIHQKLGANKVYHCEKCDTRVDRDLNAARNILLKHITKNG